MPSQTKNKSDESYFEEPFLPIEYKKYITWLTKKCRAMKNAAEITRTLVMADSYKYWLNTTYGGYL